MQRELDRSGATSCTEVPLAEGLITTGPSASPEQDDHYGDWAQQFLTKFDAKARANRKRRRRRRNVNRMRRTAEPATQETRDELSEKQIFGDLMRERARSRARTVQNRLEHGFRWHGGCAGDNPRYMRQPFVHRPLVSDEDPILKLFVTKLPRAGKFKPGKKAEIDDADSHAATLMTGDTKAEIDGTDCKLLALDCAYVVANARMRGVLRVDFDEDLPSWEAIRDVCRAAGVPPPNIAVGHVDPHGRVLHPHFIWILVNSVTFNGKGRSAPKRLFTAVLRGLTAALQPHKADPDARSNAMKMKNPLSPLWSREVLAPTPYKLVDLRPRATTIGKSTDPQSGDLATRQWFPDDPGPQLAARSNGLFNDLRAWAYQNVERFREIGKPFEAFRSAAENEASRICSQLNGDTRRAERAVLRTAQSVAEWTWTRYRPRQAKPDTKLAADEVRARQADAGRATASRRHLATENAIRTAALRLALEAAAIPTQAAVMAATGKAERTVRRYWPQVLSALEAMSNREPPPAIRSPIVKKGAASADDFASADGFQVRESLGDGMERLSRVDVAPLPLPSSVGPTSSGGPDPSVTPVKAFVGPGIGGESYAVDLAPSASSTAPEFVMLDVREFSASTPSAPVSALSEAYLTPEYANARPLTSFDLRALPACPLLIQPSEGETGSQVRDRVRALVYTMLSKTGGILTHETVTAYQLFRKINNGDFADCGEGLFDKDFVVVHLDRRSFPTKQNGEAIDYYACFETLFWQRLHKGLPTLFVAFDPVGSPAFNRVYSRGTDECARRIMHECIEVRFGPLTTPIRDGAETEVLIDPDTGESRIFGCEGLCRFEPRSGIAPSRSSASGTMTSAQGSDLDKLDRLDATTHRVHCLYDKDRAGDADYRSSRRWEDRDDGHGFPPARIAASIGFQATGKAAAEEFRADCDARVAARLQQEAAAAKSGG